MNSLNEKGNLTKLNNHTIREAVELVLQTTILSKQGDIFLLDMGKPVKIMDLAKRMIKLSGLTIRNVKNPKGDIEIITTKLRPGEKLYEELLISGKPIKTIHPLIFKAAEEEILIGNFWEIIEELKISLSKLDLQKVYQLISLLVPEWEMK